MISLDDLNPAQRQAITAGTGPVLVLAGPGSGKTRVLTHRIAYLIGELGVRPYRILAVTFTNKAAREMKERAIRLLPPEIASQAAQELRMGTFHSVFSGILRREAARLPVNSAFVIFDADDQITLVKRAIKDLNLDEKLYRANSVLNAISSAKNERILAADYPAGTYRDAVIARVYKRYQELLVASNAVDFDDLLLYTWQLLNDHPDVRDQYARRFEFLLVDEFQDTNTVQYEILCLLASAYRNLFVVGDEDQSIYRWRGADYRNVLRFEKDFPDAQKILLEQNYRSTQNILDAARGVIDRNFNRTPKRLRSMPERGTGERLNLYEAVDDYGEAAYVVDTIQQMVSARRAKPGDFAVMYRTNAQSRLFEEAFLRAGMPYRLVGAQRFYGRREVKDVIAYLRLVMNPADEVSLGRVINVPARGIGDKAQVGLQLAARQAETGAGAVLLDLARRGKESPAWTAVGRAANLLADFGALLLEWRQTAAQEPLHKLFERILNDINYKEYIDDGTEEGRGRWENVLELQRIAYEYDDRGLTAFLENMALVSDQDTLPEQADAPTLLTLHAAKGLEFPIVFITGLDDGMLPHSRSLDDPEEMAEERRLFYVGLTRAKLRIYLVRASQRSAYGDLQDTNASRFLRDIPAELVQESAGGRRSGGGFSQRRDERASWNRSPASSRGPSRSSYESGGTYAVSPPQRVKPQPPAAPKETRYRAGMHVRHATWGDGLVIESRMQDGDETLDVAFKSVGLKKLLASLANLEIVD